MVTKKKIAKNHKESKDIEFDDSIFSDEDKKNAEREIIIEQQIIKKEEEKSLLQKIDLPKLKEDKEMGLLRKEVPKEVNKLSEEDLNTIQGVFNDTFSHLDDGQEDKLKDTEIVKVIVKELLSVDKHLPSTTKLNNIQVTELAQAKYLNSFFKSPIIDIYMNQFMKLKRSETKEITTNLLDGLLNIGTSSSSRNNQFDDSKGILGNRWKR